MIDGGYLAKRIALRPGLPSHVAEVCSVSTCISPGPDDAVKRWLHNELGWYNTIELAWSVVPEVDRAGHRLFAYRLLETRYHKGSARPFVLPADVRPDPIPQTFEGRGFDAVSRFAEDVIGFECSPLSCNGLATELGTNRHCLFATFDDAVAAARTFSIDEPEPGDYFVVEVLELGEPCEAT